MKTHQLLFILFFLCALPFASRAQSTGDVYNDPASYHTYYLTIADTGKNYYKLRDEMYALHTSIPLKIDTMNRYYNKKEGIILRENDEDEIYRGAYFPRRDAGIFLSLEYLDTYTRRSGKNTIALVAGFYETAKQANATLQKIKAKAPHAYVLRARVYVGCMH
jgi:hypothetical protein